MNSLCFQILALGTLHGVTMIPFVISKGHDNFLRKLTLVLIIFILAFDNFQTIYISHYSDSNFLVDSFYLTLPLFIGPLILCYIQSFWKPTWDNANWRYFKPFIALLILKLVFSGTKAMGLEIDIITKLNDCLVFLFEPLMIGNLGFFIGLAWYGLKKSEVSGVLKSKITYILITVSASSVLVIILLLIQTAVIPEQTKFLNVILGIISTLAVYSMVFLDFKNTKVHKIIIEKTTNLHFSNLDDQLVEACFQKIEIAIRNEKIFLNPELSLSMFAEHLSVSPKTLSAVIHNKYSKGFNDFINTYRVEEVKQRLVDPNNSKLSITGIAYESGFNSIATFQRVFKKHVGMTPSEFLKNNTSQFTN